MDLTIKLPSKVVAEDKELAKASHKLCHLRWHWTLDETNDKRTTISQYARQCGVDEKRVRADAHAWQDWQDSAASGRSPAPGKPRTLGDFQAKRRMGEEFSQAAAAIAKHTGQSYANVSTNHRNEVRMVIDSARERVAEDGVTFAHALNEAAKSRQQARVSVAKEKDWRRKHFRMETLKMVSCLGYAVSRVREAYKIAQDLDFEGEELEFLTSVLGSLRALVNLLDRRVIGKEQVDFDAEMKQLVKEFESKEG